MSQKSGAVSLAMRRWMNKGTLSDIPALFYMVDRRQDDPPSSSLTVPSFLMKLRMKSSAEASVRADTVGIGRDPRGLTCKRFL